MLGYKEFASWMHKKFGRLIYENKKLITESARVPERIEEKGLIFSAVSSFGYLQPLKASVFT
jgi:hypothetical protein